MTRYEADFYEWTKATARAIEAGRSDEIDRVALADEVESLGDRDRREVRSRMSVILLHMLKQRYQPERATRSWSDSILEQQDMLSLVLRDSPSLGSHLAELLPEAYKSARIKAARQTGIDLATFPKACPWTPSDVLEVTKY